MVVERLVGTMLLLVTSNGTVTICGTVDAVNDAALSQIYPIYCPDQEHPASHVVLLDTRQVVYPHLEGSVVMSIAEVAVYYEVDPGNVCMVSWGTGKFGKFAKSTIGQWHF